MKNIEIIDRMNTITEKAEDIKSHPESSSVLNLIDEITDEINNLEHYRNQTSVEMYDYIDTALMQYRIIRCSMNHYINI